MHTKLIKKICVLLLVTIVCFPMPSMAKTWRASIAQMPIYAVNHDEGVLPDFVKAMERVSGEKIEFVVVPFARSMSYVQNRRVDFHMPLIKMPFHSEHINQMPLHHVPHTEAGTSTFDYSTETIFHVNFTLYTKKGSVITPENVKDYAVETDLAHVDYFDFPITPSTSIGGSLKRVDAGRIDAFIFADNAADPIVKREELFDLKRQLFKRYDVKIILPKGGRGGPTDVFLSNTIEKMRESGEFDEIMGVLDSEFQPW